MILYPIQESSARCSLPHCRLLTKAQVVIDYPKTRCSSLEVSLDLFAHLPVTARYLNGSVTKLFADLIDHCSPGCEWYLAISFEGTTPKKTLQQARVKDDQDLLANRG